MRPSVRSLGTHVLKCAHIRSQIPIPQRSRRRLCESDEGRLCLWDNYNPVKVRLTADDEEDCTIWLECEALDRIATAFERIADAMTGKAQRDGQKS